YGIDGKAYLEKIIQASFSLPKIDKLRLRRTLFSKLWVIGGESGFKENIWHEVMNVYFSGLDSLIRNPRDIIRVTNALNMTYPPVKSEIFSPDFVAIEFIRIFCPKLYTTIKSNKKYFAGPNDERHTDREELIKFHNAWLENIDEVN
ncbi:NTPase KAP, partial [Muribaculaceae bacterium Isolate-002 (NCI)]